MLHFKYNTAEHLSKVNCPTLIIHSRYDEIMPFVHGQRLFETAPEPKKFLELTGTHNEGFITSGTRYEEGLNTFIRQYLEVDVMVGFSRAPPDFPVIQHHPLTPNTVRIWYGGSLGAQVVVQRMVTLGSHGSLSSIHHASAKAWCRRNEVRTGFERAPGAWRDRRLGRQAAFSRTRKSMFRFRADPESSQSDSRTAGPGDCVGQRASAC